MEPSYGVVSNSKDMARWIEFILSSSTTADLKLDQDGIPCTGCRKVFSKGPGSPPTDTEVVYALGTRTGMYRDYRKWVHSGSFGGYNSYLYMLPDMKIGVFTAVNGGGDTYGAMRKIIHYAFDTMLGLAPDLSTSNIERNDHVNQDNRERKGLPDLLPANLESKETVLYQPKSLKPEFSNLIGSYYHPLLGEMKISKKNRRSCQTYEIYESLYVQIGELGTGWIENLAFYDTGLINEKYMYPLSIDPAENEQCCVGIRCNEVQKIIPGVYPLVENNDSPALDSWIDVDFIWDSRVWYVSDYDPVFTFKKSSSGEFTVEFRRGSWSSDVYVFTRERRDEFEWTDKCNLNSL
ncbi:Oidioi.mRNA.OKI2018_I69.chr2.g6300.t1.cds [Oikopleura dioica]|uniref:Oidioi.mRNA.OKI2018_I69.chr2.g6300.t1.cds n=1 Tax=Oikopleura dioica TaxID=34765 RepID=A0ABN7T7B9_OIKDI|nr:Oidioi.mRNA.OKI2018_I69.chr2.g6300.t1.cds [Oikopleura dioica]